MAFFHFLKWCKHRYIIIDKRRHFTTSLFGYDYSVAPKIVILCEKCAKSKTITGAKINLRCSMNEKSELLFDIIANEFLEKINIKYISFLK